MFICKHCKKEFEGLSTSQKANHSRWCNENPKRESYVVGSGKQLNTKESIRKRNIGIKLAHEAGKYKDSYKKALQTKLKNNSLYHTEESKELIRQKALNSKHRRLIRSVREYMKKDGTIVMLDSSWEEELAKRLDECEIDWIRPETPIEYLTHDGTKHNYFPDFYLPKYDLFLDPKNPAAINAQKEKIEILLKNMNNLIILDTLEKCKSFHP